MLIRFVYLGVRFTLDCWMVLLLKTLTMLTSFCTLALALLTRMGLP